MLGGDASAVPFHAYCYEEWRSKYGTKPPWINKDYILLAKALKAIGDEERARASWDAFLKSKDIFHEGHAPGKFVTTMSRWAVKAIPKKQVEGKAVSDHVRIMREVYNDPKFTTRQEMKDETARRMRELD